VGYSQRLELLPLTIRAMTRRIRLVVVEDNRLLREGLTVMLKEQPDISVVASLSNGDALIRGKRLKPDVILLDFVLRSRTSLRLVQSIRTTNPDARVIVMDLAPIQPSLVDYVQAGVAGFVLKDATFTDFLQTIRDVARGKKVLPPTLTSSLFSEIATHATRHAKGNPFKSVRMTIREREVIELIAEGLSNKQIAVRLNLAVDTVKSHVHNILEKLALHTRLEIASYRHTGGEFHASPHDNRASED
jgi:DNA-binding NarL/FixJ family response regulator